MLSYNMRQKTCKDAVEFMLCWPPTAAHGSVFLHLYLSCRRGWFFLLFVCFVLFQFFFILSRFNFYFWDTERIWIQMGGKRKGRTGRSWGSEKQNTLYEKKSIFCKRKKKETVMKTLSETALKSGRYPVKIKDLETAVARRIGRDPVTCDV